MTRLTLLVVGALSLGARASCDPPDVLGAPSSACGFAPIDDPGSLDPSPVFGTVENCWDDDPTLAQRSRAALVAARASGELLAPCRGRVSLYRRLDGREKARVCSTAAPIIQRVIDAEIPR